MLSEWIPVQVPPTGRDSYHCEASSDQVKVFQGNLAKVRFGPLKTKNYIYDTYWTVNTLLHCTVIIILFHHTVHRRMDTEEGWDWVQMDRRNVYPLLFLFLLLVDYFTLDVIVLYLSKDWGLNEDVYTRSVSSSIDRASNGGCGLDMRATVTSV